MEQSKPPVPESAPPPRPRRFRGQKTTAQGLDLPVFDALPEPPPLPPEQPPDDDAR